MRMEIPTRIDGRSMVLDGLKVYWSKADTHRLFRFCPILNLQVTIK